LQIRFGQRWAILSAFDRLEHRHSSARDKSLHHIGLRSIGRGHLRRIHKAQSARRPSTRVDQASTRQKCCVDHLYCRRHIVQDSSNRIGNRLIFCVQQANDLACRRTVDFHCSWVYALGLQCCELVEEA
jgi:hypothetical protein